MINEKKIVVVIPAFNVEDQIAEAIKTIPAYVDSIIVVDDKSKDNTANIISKIKDERIKLLKNKKNLGVGGSTIVGLKQGLKINGDIFIKYDGDGQMDPNKMELLIKSLFEGYDYSKGNRFIHIDELNKMPKLRLFGNFVLTFLTKLVSGYWHIFDPQNGYIAIKREILEKIHLDKINKRYFFENDMLVKCNILQAKIIDIPMGSLYGDEKSSLKIWKILFYFPFLFINRFINRIYLKYILYDFSVIGIFYVFGSSFMLFGFVFGVEAWIRSVITGVVTTTGTVMISVLPIIIGFQLFLQAIVLEINNSQN